MCYLMLFFDINVDIHQYCYYNLIEVNNMSDFIKDINYRISKDYFKTPLEFEGIFIVQIGRLFSKKTTVINEHVHTIFFELTVVTDGEGIISTNGIPSHVKKGDIYLSLPCDIHKIETDPEKLLKFDNIAFYLSDNVFSEEFDRIQLNYRAPEIRIFQDDRIRPLISNAIVELNSENAHKEAMLTSIFKQILIYTSRALNRTEPVRFLENTLKAEIVCHEIMNYIDTHVYTMKNLDELSKVCNYSYGYLSSIFKKTTGHTLSNYYQERKLETSRLLLIENKLSITEIAELLNYASLYAFSKAFTKHFGISPQKYKKSKISFS